jgi:hypothetical protein
MTLHKAMGLVPARPASVGIACRLRRPGRGKAAAIITGMRRVTISHCDYRRGPATPSLFLDDTRPALVPGWLHQPGSARASADASMTHAELLRRF